MLVLALFCLVVPAAAGIQAAVYIYGFLELFGTVKDGDNGEENECGA